MGAAPVFPINECLGFFTKVLGTASTALLCKNRRRSLKCLSSIFRRDVLLGRICHCGLGLSWRECARVDLPARDDAQVFRFKCASLTSHVEFVCKLKNRPSDLLRRIWYPTKLSRRMSPLVAAALMACAGGGGGRFHKTEPFVPKITVQNSISLPIQFGPIRVERWMNMQRPGNCTLPVGFSNTVVLTPHVGGLDLNPNVQRVHLTLLHT